MLHASAAIRLPSRPPGLPEFLSALSHRTQPHNMSAPLPSFVELMASLGLSADNNRPGSADSSRRSSYSASPSASPSLLHVPSKPSRREKSPAIRVTQYDSTHEAGDFKRRASSGNIRGSRFTPYASTPRRGSVSSLSSESSQLDGEHPTTHSVLSSRRSSSNSMKKSGLPRHPELKVRRGSDLQQLNIAAASCTPISSFARRRSPHNSPTSPSFSHQRTRSTSAELPSPVTIPTLPPLLAESLASYSLSAASKHSVPTSSRSRSPSLDPMAVDSDSRAFVKHNQAGLRISSFHRQVSPVS